MFEIDFFSQSEQAVINMANEKLRIAGDDWEKQIWQFVSNWYNTSITSIQLSTSGSTGVPKQITHSKSAMLSSAAATCNALNLQAGSTALLCLPINKIGGMMMIVRSILNKMKLVCIKPSTTPFQTLPDTFKIDFAAFTPMQFYEVIANRYSYNKANKMAKIILGGEDLKLESIPFIRQLKCEVYTTFGMTETISHIALKRINGDSPDVNFKVLPGINVSVDDRSCLVIEAPQLGQPHLVTNDVISLVGKNEFQWLGRADNVINSGGVKIYPEEIERQLLKALTTPYFISSLPDSKSGEQVVLALETDKLSEIEKGRLTSILGNLGKLSRPKRAVLIPLFIRTENGKLKRKESLLNAIEVVNLAYQE